MCKLNWRRMKPSDIDLIRSIDRTLVDDRACPYEADPTGRFEAALQTGQVWVLAKNQKILSFIHVEKEVGSAPPDQISAISWEIAAMAVDPTSNRKGFGTFMLDRFLRETPSTNERSVTTWTTTSPHNVAMLRTLFTCKFVATRYQPLQINNQDRLLLEYLERPPYPPTSVHLVPIGNIRILKMLLGHREFVLTGIKTSCDTEKHFRLELWPGYQPSGIHKSITGLKKSQ